ncbi:MAG: FGGY family carbohydrate kinase, partial [Dehalococcoidia bacterium]
MAGRFILALDQGTSSSRALLVDSVGNVAGVAVELFPQLYPRPGWVEHDPEEIWRSQLLAARRVIRETGVRPTEIAAIGITNQRETVVVWDRRTGMPISNAIVWQCRRTADACDALKRQGHEPFIHERSGLVVDAFFSASKIAWLLDDLPGARKRAEAGELAAGTIDSWLIHRLTGGRAHVTDPTNASRTMLFNLHTSAWDEELCRLLRVPSRMLPEIRPSAGTVGSCAPDLFGAPIPIAGIAGDQQAALFGQACFSRGATKNTYGTGCFVLRNTGSDALTSADGLLATAAATGDGRRAFALEGSIFLAGAAVQWLRDGLGIIRTAADVEALAASAPDSSGVYFVPAFV